MLESRRIPRKLIIFSLHWKPEDISSDATEELSVSATGQMNLPTRVRVSSQKAKASFLTMSFQVDGLDLGWVFHINWSNQESPSWMCPAACILLIPNEVKLTMKISHTVSDFKAPLSSVEASFTNKETFYSVELFRHQMTSHVIFCPADTEHTFFPAACGVLSKMNYFAWLKAGLKRRWEKMGLIPRILSDHSGAKLETNIPGNPRRKHKYLETEKCVCRWTEETKEKMSDFPESRDDGFTECEKLGSSWGLFQEWRIELAVSGPQPSQCCPL